MFSTLPEPVLSKIIELMDSDSCQKFSTAASVDEKLWIKLQIFKHNVCPFCLMRKISNPLSLVKPIIGDEIFDHQDAFLSFLYKDHTMYLTKNLGHCYKLIQIDDRINGRYIDEEYNEHSFEQVLDEKSLVDAWKQIIISSRTFSDNEFEDHLLTHFIGVKNIQVKSTWSPDEMYRIIEETAQKKDFFIDPGYYSNKRYLDVGSIQDELNRIICYKYLVKDDVIGPNLDQFKINLSKHLINETLDLLTNIGLLSKPTVNLNHFLVQINMLKRIFERM